MFSRDEGTEDEHAEDEGQRDRVDRGDSGGVRHHAHQSGL